MSSTDYKTVIWQQFDIADAPNRLEVMARNDEVINNLASQVARGVVYYEYIDDDTLPVSKAEHWSASFMVPSSDRCYQFELQFDLHEAGTGAAEAEFWLELDGTQISYLSVKRDPYDANDDYIPAKYWSVFINAPDAGSHELVLFADYTGISFDIERAHYTISDVGKNVDPTTDLSIPYDNPAWNE